MLNSLLNLLNGTSHERLPEPDAQLALAALLVRIAKSDGRYSAAETDQIDQVMATRYGLAAADVAELRSQAEAL